MQPAVFRRIVPALVLGLVLSGPGWRGAARGDCVDYSSYLHTVGHVSTPDYAKGVAVSGHYAYIADYNSGFLVVDVADRASPRIVGALPGPMTDLVVAVAGRYAYVGGMGGLEVIDISVPADPRLAYWVSAPLVGEVDDIEIQGDYAYLADPYGGGFAIVDISNPAAFPRVVARLSLPQTGSHGVAVAGNRAYVAGRGLFVIDISDPACPHLLGSVYTPSGQKVAVAGHYAYVADELIGLRIVDVSDPTAPRIVGTAPVVAPVGVAVTGSIAAVADNYETDGLTFVDVSDPESPQIIGHVGSSGDANNVCVANSTAYLAEDFGLEVVDATNPASPPITGNLPLSQAPMGLVVSGSTAFIADYSQGVVVVDITDPASPRLVTTVPTQDYTYNVDVEGDYLYVVNYDTGLQVMDVSDPAAAHVVGSLSLPGEAYAVTASGGYAYVSALDAGLDIVDVSNPTSPALTSRIGLPDWALGTAVTGTIAFVADQNAGLQVVDCSNPASPHVIGSVATPGEATSVALGAGRAYLSWLSSDFTSSGLEVVDISNPTSPQALADVWSPGFPNEVRVSGQYVYVADVGAGVQVLDVLSATAPQPIGDALSDARELIVSGGHLFVVNIAGSGLYVLPTQCDLSAVGETTAQRPILLVAAPNPTRGETSIRFSTEQQGRVRLNIFDPAGRVVRALLDEPVGEGSHGISWDGRDAAGRQVPRGVYFARLETPVRAAAERIVVAR